MDEEIFSKEFFDFLYRNSLCEELNLRAPYYNRLTFSSLQEILSLRKEPFTITDLGAGEGRFDIALALSFANLEKVYAIDYLESALTQIGLSKGLLDPEERELTERKVVPVLGDYNDPEFIKKFTSQQRSDVALNICTTNFDVFYNAPKFINQKGTVINYTTHYLNDGEDRFSAIESELRGLIENPDFSMAILNRFRINPKRIVVASEFKRRE